MADRIVDIDVIAKQGAEGRAIFRPDAVVDLFPAPGEVPPKGFTLTLGNYESGLAKIGGDQAEIVTTDTVGRFLKGAG